MKRTKLKISVIVPAYNEEENISPLMNEFAKLDRSWNEGLEVLFIDDGSRDKTWDRARRLASKHRFLRVFRHRANFGITRALETGFANARGEVFCFFPADLQFLAADIPRLAGPILADTADVVTGRKIGRYEKRFVSGVYNLLSRILFGVKVKDLNSVKAFRREAVEDIVLRKDWHRYLVALAASDGWRIEEVDVTLKPRLHGKSKFSFWRIPIGVLDLISVSFLLRYSRKPMLLFGTLGGVSFALGVISGLVYLGFLIFSGTGLRPLLFLVVLLVLMGLLLVIAGFIAEQIAQIKAELDQLRKRDR
ncbi:glycosyltransferase [candidate division WOR-3 bacterium]|uniref:Glycosyltransferase n=1 Tax=candidate division WOR-3 bacterium TaxID=2052148 RepID=A0A9D5K8Q1_UNCW3|nr:glycosyltransferase [candidate division WOR-3 bacterium]MBD3363664.1 glycosyltransferase [candidate division WOR-3 bacterium]